jgi:hypothetical protein
MNESSRHWELEFQLAVATYLSDECGLPVHVEGDVLNRRRSGYAMLQFQFRYPEGPNGPARVKVAVGGSSGSRSFSVQLRDPEDVAKVLGECEELAPHIREALEQAPQAPTPPGGRGRREDD